MRKYGFTEINYLYGEGIRHRKISEKTEVRGPSGKPM